MKIVVLIWDFFGAGAERVAVLLANGMRQLGHEVSVIVGRSEGPFRDALRPDIPVLAPDGQGSRRALAHLRTVLSRERPDVLLSHQTTRNVLAILAHLTSPGRRRRIVVAVEHGEMAKTAMQTKSRGLRVYFCLARAFYPLADRIVAVSGNVERSVRLHLRPIPIAPLTLPNPVVFPELAALAGEGPRHRFFHNGGGPVFVAVGRLEAQKNYSLLLRAFALLVRSTPARLVVYGEGSLRERLLAERDALGLGARADFAGFCANPFSEMRASAALTLSSEWEGLPTVAIEALACGGQVVSTDNSEGVREILRGGALGWITPVGDAEALAGAMRAALSAPKDKDLLKAAAKAYEVVTVASKYLQCFESLRSARGMAPLLAEEGVAA